MKKVAIVGAHEMTRSNAPFDDPEFDIWSMSDWICADWLKRCDLLLEIHQPGQYMNHPRTPQYWDTLQGVDIPVYMYPIADPRLKQAVEYPLDGVLKMLAGGQNFGKFKPLNCSVAYLIALAIYQGYEQIDIYGVELAGEYIIQQPMFTFWSGFALGKGVKLNVNCSAGLFNQPLYGLEDTTEREKIKAMIAGVEQQKSEAKQMGYMAEGALQFAQALLEETQV